MKPCVYIDSAVWIARFEGQPSYKQAINGFLHTFDTIQWTVCISDAVFLEVLFKPYGNNRTDIINIYQQVLGKRGGYLTTWGDSRTLTPLPPEKHYALWMRFTLLLLRITTVNTLLLPTSISRTYPRYRFFGLTSQQ